MYAGRYRYPDGRLGSEIRVGNTQQEIITGINSRGKGVGLIIPNPLMHRGVSQFVIDTRIQAAVASVP